MLRPHVPLLSGFCIPADGLIIILINQFSKLEAVGKYVLGFSIILQSQLLNLIYGGRFFALCRLLEDIDGYMVLN